MQLPLQETGEKMASVYPVVDDKQLNSLRKSVVTFSFSSLIFQQYKIGFKQELT